MLSDQRVKEQHIKERQPPQGQRMVNEWERQKSIIELKDTRDEIINQLDRYPFNQNTSKLHRSPRYLQEREQLEKKLIKVTNALNKFHNPPVFINI